VTDVFRSGDALFAIDGELRVVSWNDAAQEMTGISAEHAVGRPCWDVVGALGTRGDLVCHKGCSGARLMRQGWPVCAQELLIKAKGGRKRVTLSTISVRSGSEALYLHLMRNGEDAAAPDGDAPSMRTPELTPRQLEVLEALSAGEPARAIARRLGIAETTVRNHIRAILVALCCHSQLEAVAEARRRRLLS
jgi:PAS domain S-box-containing protein